MTAWIVRLVAQGGPWGVFLLMLVENVLPPIPSELIMPLAGFACARGQMSWLAAVGAGSAGSVAGAWAWYEFGRKLGRDRMARWVEAHGRWLAVTPAEFARVDGWFHRHGAWILVLGRCLPGVRGVICIPAGVTGMSRHLRRRMHRRLYPVVHFPGRGGATARGALRTGRQVDGPCLGHLLHRKHPGLPRAGDLLPTRDAQ